MVQHISSFSLPWIAATFGGKYDSPALCSMSLAPCEAPLPGWTVGLDGTCVNENCGYRLGKTIGYTKAILQVSASLIYYITMHNASGTGCFVISLLEGIMHYHRVVELIFLIKFSLCCAKLIWGHA